MGRCVRAVSEYTTPLYVTVHFAIKVCMCVLRSLRPSELQTPHGNGQVMLCVVSEEESKKHPIDFIFLQEQTHLDFLSSQKQQNQM